MLYGNDDRPFRIIIGMIFNFVDKLRRITHKLSKAERALC